MRFDWRTFLLSGWGDFFRTPYPYMVAVVIVYWFEMVCKC